MDPDDNRILNNDNADRVIALARPTDVLHARGGADMDGDGAVAAAAAAGGPARGTTAPRAGGPTPPLGTMVADGLDRPGPHRVPRPVEGPPVGRHLRRRRPGRPLAGRRRCRPKGVGPGFRRRAPAPELGRGRHRLLGRGVPGSGRGARRALLRAERGRLHPRVTDPDVVVTADRFGHVDHLANYEGLLGRAPRPAAGWWRATTAAAPCRPGPTPFADLLDAEPARRARAGRPRRPGDHRLHLGHDPGPEGRRALPPHDRLRDPPARPHVPEGRAAADHRRPGRPLHRHGQRLPGPAAAGAAGQPGRRLGPRRGPPPDDGGGPRRHRRRHLLPDQPPRPPRLHRRAPGP